MQTIFEQVKKEENAIQKVQEKLHRIQQRQEALGRNTSEINEHYIS